MIDLRATAAVLGLLAMAHSADASEFKVKCQVQDVSVFADLVRIQCKVVKEACDARPGPCTEKKENPPIVATEASNPMANALVQMAVASIGDARALWVHYEDAPSGNPKDCPDANCRRLLGATLR